MLLVSSGSPRRRSAGVQPMNASRDWQCQAAEPNNRQATGLPSQARARIAEVFPDTVVVTQIMMALEQPVEQPGFRSARTDRVHPQRKQGLQTGVEGGPFDRRFGGVAISMAVDRGAPPGRQPDESALLQFEQQRPARHVLEPPRLVAPPPAHAKFAGDPRAVPGGLLDQESLDLMQILIPEGASLD